MKREFKGNSQSKKIEDKNPVGDKEITPITSNVNVKKQSELSKFKNNFFTEDSKSVRSHIFSTVIVPGIQRLISDSIKNGIDWLLFGTKGSGSTRSGARNISYSSIFDGGRRTSSYNRSSGHVDDRRNVWSVNDVTFVERGEAEAVLMRLREEVDRYQMVSVADFYGMISQRHSFQDNKWGWRNLDNADVVRSRDGYSIRFPKIIPIE